jgi:hypothetical protein
MGEEAIPERARLETRNADTFSVHVSFGPRWPSVVIARLEKINSIASDEIDQPMFLRDAP